MGVLLQGFFFDVKSASATDWWDHLAGQAQDFGKAWDPRRNERQARLAQPVKL